MLQVVLFEEVEGFLDGGCVFVGPLTVEMLGLQHCATGIPSKICDEKRLGKVEFLGVLPPGACSDIALKRKL